MRVSYTLAEINSCNKLGNLVIAEVGAKGKKSAPQFKTTDEAVIYIRKHEKTKSSHVEVYCDETHVHIEVSEELILDTIEFFGRHVSTLIGLMNALKGVAQMCKTLVSSVKEDFLDLAKKYNDE